MATEVRFRRGTTAQHATFIGAPAEITVDTDKKTVVVHDGVTAGGFPLASDSTALKFTDTLATLKDTPLSYERVYVKAHSTEGDGGHGVFRSVTGAAAGTYVDNNGTIIVPTGGDGSSAWVREFTGALNVKWFGAKGDGVSDDTAAIQACANTGRNFYIPSGTYKISSAIQLQAGQIVEGANSGNFAGSEKTVVINNAVGGGCFWFTQDSSTGQKKMPTVRNISLQADYPIRFNDETTAVILDGAGSNVPYGMKPFIINCDINPRVAGTGIGVSWSKMFDGAIEDCEIQGFAINVLLNGCDLNRVANNRIRAAHQFQILELAASTFGSQNEIQHNDILQAGSSSCIFIKSTARHTRIYNNYLEQSVGADGSALVGFIDVSTVSAPSFAGNVGAGRFSAIVRDNRIDGFAKASAFVYRYEPDGQTYGEISDVGTVGPVASAPVLLLCDSAGNNINRVPFSFNQFNLATYKFHGHWFGRWNGYESNSDPSLTIDGTNLSMFGASALNTNLARNYLRASGRRIIFLNGFTSHLLLSFQDTEALFNLSRTYEVEVVARCVSGTETLSVGRMLNGSGSALTTFTLTNKFAPYTIQFVSGSSATDDVGIYFARSNNGADIEIESINIRQLYLNELPRTVTSSTVFTVQKPVGKILVCADGSSAVPAYYVYEFVNGVLVVTGSSVTNPSVIDVSFSQSGNNITFNVTGTGGGKAIQIYHLAK